MATTSMWRVKGWLGKVLIYAENPDKTENPAFFETPDIDESGLQRLDDVIAYAAREDKTEQHHFVSGVNVSPTTARDEMMEIKRKFEKVGGTVAYHGYQSFAPGETTPEVAHQIGVRLAEELWGSAYQVIVATHTDQGHLHNHFVLNTVSMIDGKKFYRSKSDYQAMRDMSDALCKEYGLSVIHNPKQGRTKHYGEWNAEREGKPTWRSIIKTDVDEAITQATSTKQFFQNLKNLGYEIKSGADISVRPPGKERFFRLVRNFGNDYSEEAIKKRVLSQMVPQLTISKQDYKIPEQTKLPSIPKGTIVGLYRHYCFLFGVYKNKGAPRMPFALREEHRHFDAIVEDEKLLNRESIETALDLTTFKESREDYIATLTGERKRLQALDRKTNGGKTPDSPNPRITEINEYLKALRKEVRQCKRIAERSVTLAEKLSLIEQPGIPTNRKEVRHGRNRAGNRTTHTDHAHGH